MDDLPHPLTAADTLEVDLEAELGDELYQAPHEGRGSAEVALPESLQTMQVPVDAFDDNETRPVIVVPHPGAGQARSFGAPSTLLLAIPPEMLID